MDIGQPAQTYRVGGGVDRAIAYGPSGIIAEVLAGEIPGTGIQGFLHQAVA